MVNAMVTLKAKMNGLLSTELCIMRLFKGLSRPMGGFFPDQGEQRAEAARGIEDRLSRHIDRKLNIEFGRLTRRMEILMVNVQARLREVIEVVKSQSTRIDSLNTLMDGMRNEIQRLLVNAGTDDTTMALVDQLFDEAKRNDEAIDAALAENQGGTPLPLPGTTAADAVAAADAAAKAQAEADAAQREADELAAKVKAKAEADAAAAAAAGAVTDGPTFGEIKSGAADPKPEPAAQG